MEHSPVILAAQGRAAFQPKGLIAPLFSGFRLIPGINAGAIHIEPRWGYRSETRGVLKIDYWFFLRVFAVKKVCSSSRSLQSQVTGYVLQVSVAVAFFRLEARSSWLVACSFSSRLCVFA